MKSRALIYFPFAILAATILLFVAAVIALSRPSIQTKVIKKLTSIISEEIGHPVEIGYVNISWFDEAFLKDVWIRDTQGEEMIHVDRLNVNFSLSSFLNNGGIHLDQARLTGADVSLRNNAPESGLNITWFVIKLREALTGSRDKKNTRPFSLASATIEKSSFSLNNLHKDSLSDRWDYSHFHLLNVEADLRDIKIHGDTFEVDIRRLDCLDKQTQMQVADLNVFFSISQSSMLFDNLEMDVGSSHIRNNMTFRYDTMSALANFNYLVDIEAHLEDTRIHSKDIGWFAPYFSRYDASFDIAGKFKGSINRFFFEDFRIAFGEESVLNGDLNITGLPQYEEALFDIDLNDSYVAAVDMRSMMADDLFTKIRQIDYLKVKDITLTGFLYDFVAQGAFNSPLGNIRSDINLKLTRDPENSSYSGAIALSDFNVGKLFTVEEWMRKMDMTGEVKGRGLKLANADLELKAFFNYFDINGYRYRNINADGHFTRELFNGNLSVRDENLQLNASALINLREEQSRINIKARLDTAFLQEINLSTQNYFVSSDIEVDITGLEFDDILGQIALSNLYVSRDNRDMHVEYINLASEMDEAERLLHIDSDLLRVNLSGEFDYSTLLTDLKRQYGEYRLAILNQKEDIRAYYEGKEFDPQMNDYALTYQVDLKDINPLIRLYSSGFVSRDAQIEGVLQGGSSNLFSLYSTIDTISVGNFIFFQNLVDLKIGNDSDSVGVQASMVARSERQLFNRTERANNLDAEVSWIGDHVSFSSGVELNGGNNIFISGALDFLEDNTRIVLDSSAINILGKNWRFSADNEILIENKTASISNLKVYHEDQSVSINGTLNAVDLDRRVLTMDIQNLLLANLNSIIKKGFSGIMDGRINIGNHDDPLGLEGRLKVDGFMIDNFPVGDIVMDSYWNRQMKQLNIGVSVLRDQDKIIVMNGYFDPGAEQDQLHLYARLNKASLNISEPFIAKYFSRIGGFVSGEFTINGSLSHPVIRGTGHVEDGAVVVNYLNTRYTFSGVATMDENKIGVDNLVVYDDERNIARLSGGFYHSGLRNFVMDINGRFESFKALNTSSKDNKLYYGIAIVSGNVEFLGSLTNLNISANATTEKGTKIFIPLNESSTIEQENFITFKNSGDSLLQNALVNKIDLRGLKMNFDLEITPDAYCEMIFDIKAGDIIRGRGNGRLKLQIDTEGDFRMFGDYEIAEGGYNFTLYNVINKEFTIIPNSRISWTGDPYKAQMNIKATYEQMASFAPLLDSALADHPDIKRKYPAIVLLDLQGDLMSPDINFDIEINEYPSMIIGLDGGSYPLEADISGFRTKIKADEQELKRQVFSLMALRRFSPENSFNVSGSLGNSVSEFISNQLSYWVTQFDENLEIDVDLNSLDQEAFNTFQLRLSYTTLGGRLRITRDGGFTNQQNQTSFGAIAGDWTVEYLLSPNGKLRVKMYNKTNYNPVNASLKIQSTTTAGFSLLHTESFDKISEVFMNIKKAREQEENSDEEEVKTTEAIIRDDAEAQAGPSE